MIKEEVEIIKIWFNSLPYDLRNKKYRLVEKEDIKELNKILKKR